MKNEDDILECALNSGLEFASKKYDITVNEVYSMVRKFKVDIGDLCSCEKERLEGNFIMCFICDGDRNRIKI